MQVGVEPVLGAETGVGDVAEHVLGEQRRREGEGGDQHRDHRPEQAPREGRSAGEHAEIGAECDVPEMRGRRPGRPRFRLHTGQAARPGPRSAAGTRAEPGAASGQGAEQQAGEAGEADGATAGCSQVSPPLPPGAGGGAAGGGGAGGGGGEGAGAGAGTGTGCWVPAPGA